MPARWGPPRDTFALLLFIILINDIGFEGQENNTGDLITSKRNLSWKDYCAELIFHIIMNALKKFISICTQGSSKK